MRASATIFFFFNDTATTEIYTLSLHDALPISPEHDDRRVVDHVGNRTERGRGAVLRSEEHTSELQSQSNLVCRLLLEKKKKKNPRSNGAFGACLPTTLDPRLRGGFVASANGVV